MSDISEAKSLSATSLSAPSLSAPSADSVSPQIPGEQPAYNTQQTMEIICSDSQFLSWQYHMITDIKDKNRRNSSLFNTYSIQKETTENVINYHSTRQ